MHGLSLFTIIYRADTDQIGRKRRPGIKMADNGRKGLRAFCIMGIEAAGTTMVGNGRKNSRALCAMAIETGNGQQ